MKRSKEYKKGYKTGYNNPGQFEQQKLLQSDSDLAKGIIDGILVRENDNVMDTVRFILD